LLLRATQRGYRQADRRTEGQIQKERKIGRQTERKTEFRQQKKKEEKKKPSTHQTNIVELSSFWRGMAITKVAMTAMTATMTAITREAIEVTVKLPDM
jgi:hypothetical protein